MTPEHNTGANREPECLPSWNNRVESALLLAFSQLRQLCAEENSTLEIYPREDRFNPFVDSFCDISL